ncbi:hypothetical protein RB2083_835 [Rhodobacteraceae bacterium HTCC2083]|nr:hypothetical protein RB2083_835 [Rhodobacteraceae bacterium HTCC2083]
MHQWDALDLAALHHSPFKGTEVRATQGIVWAYKLASLNGN